jgi:hypothetical protein
MHMRKHWRGIAARYKQMLDKACDALLSHGYDRVVPVVCFGHWASLRCVPLRQAQGRTWMARP